MGTSRANLGLSGGVCLLAGLSLFSTSVENVLALDPSRALTQYVHRAWQTDDGLPQSSVQAIVQTEDGFLWLGTEEGLVRFDGLSFKVFDKTNVAVLKDNFVTALLNARDGALWVGTRGGLLRRTGTDAHFYTMSDGLPADFVTALAEDPKGGIWIATAGGGLTRWKDRSMSTYPGLGGRSDTATALFAGRDGGLWLGTERGALVELVEDRFKICSTDTAPAMGMVRAICADPAGGLWLGTSKGLLHYDGGTFSFVRQEGLHGSAIRSLLRDREGALWIGTQRGLIRYSDAQLSSYSKDDGLSDNAVMSLFQDREGSLWVGTNRGGLNQLADAKFLTYTTREGITSDMIYPILEDRRGNIWIGTDGGGLNLFRDNRFIAYGRKEGLLDGTVFSLAEHTSGDLWIGTRNGLYRLHDDKITGVPLQVTGQSGLVMAMAPSQDGSLWAGLFGIGLAHVSGSTVKMYTARDGLPSTHFTSLLEDRTGGLWIGTSGGGLCSFRDGQFRTYSERDGLPANVVFCFLPEPDGSLWIGTGGGGLCYLKDGRFRSISAKDGLFDDTVLAILPDGRGNLWMSCNKGVFSVGLADLHDVLRGAKKGVVSHSYGRDDGMKTAECNGGTQPAGFSTRSGEMWIPTPRGVVRINPKRMSANHEPPPVAIEEVIVDGVSASTSSRIEMPAGSQRIEFRYAGLSYAAPARVRFKYMLEGFDRGWIFAEGRRRAEYTNIPPGSHIFRVIACNQDGVWNETGAALAFHKEPRLYERLWFHGLWIASLVLTIVFWHSLRVRQLKAREMELARRVDAALAKIKVLSGLLPICSWCKKVRDDKGYWNQIESYIHERSEADFSHSICPECMKRHFPGITGGDVASNSSQSAPSK